MSSLLFRWVCDLKVLQRNAVNGVGFLFSSVAPAMGNLVPAASLMIPGGHDDRVSSPVRCRGFDDHALIEQD